MSTDFEPNPPPAKKEVDPSKCNKLHYHEVNEKSLIPDFINHLGPDNTEFKQESAQLADFALWVIALKKDHTSRQMHDFVRRLHGRTYTSPNEDITTIWQYLEHQTQCQGISDQTRQQATCKKYAFDTITNIGINNNELLENVVSAETPQTLKLLRNPLNYTEGEISKEEQRLKSQKDIDQRFAEFFEKIKADPLNRQQILEELKQTLPEAAKLLENFQSWILSSKPPAERLEEFVDEVANHPRPFANNSFDNIVTNIETSLDSNILRGEDVAILYKSKDYKMKILDKDFKDVLVLLVAKSLPGQSPVVNEIIESIITERRQKVDKSNTQIKELEAKKQLMQNFLNQNSIPPELIENLGNSLMVTHQYFKDQHVNRIVFTAAFNALYLAHQNRLDLQSPAFESFFLEVYPQANKETVSILRSA